MKIKSNWIKFIIKTFTSTCVAKILLKLGLLDQWLWEIMGLTNVNNLHIHEAVGSLCPVWSLVIFKLSSSSYIQFMKKNYTFFFSFRKQSWSLSCLNYMSLFEFLFALVALKGYVSFFLHLLLFLIVLLQAQSSFWWSLFAPSFKSLFQSLPTLLS
jgi:hypothetical protein